jgi:hypothetical protein
METDSLVNKYRSVVTAYLPCKEGTNWALKHMAGIIGEDFVGVQLEPSAFSDRWSESRFIGSRLPRPASAER